MEYIRKNLPTPELLAQLAEEAAELGHAALKLRRVYDGTNPTPTTYEAALDNLHEEIADVQLLLKILGLNTPHIENLHNIITQEKLTRWTQRLKKNGRKAGKLHDPAMVVQLEAELAAALKYISAHKECDSCKHQTSESTNYCIGDCAGDCRASDCVCRFCYNGTKWEWRGTHGAK